MKQTNTFSSSSSSRCPIVRKRCRTNSGDESSEDCFELTQSSSPSRVKNAVKRFSHKKTDRRACPHCNELLSLKTYKTHKRLFYDEERLYVNVTVYGKRGHFTQTKKIEFFMLIKSYNLSQLSAKILEGKTFPVQRNWQLNWAVFSKAIELEIEKT